MILQINWRGVLGSVLMDTSPPNTFPTILLPERYNLKCQAVLAATGMNKLTHLLLTCTHCLAAFKIAQQIKQYLKIFWRGFVKYIVNNNLFLLIIALLSRYFHISQTIYMLWIDMNGLKSDWNYSCWGAWPNHLSFPTILFYCSRYDNYKANEDAVCHSGWIDSNQNQFKLKLPLIY